MSDLADRKLKEINTTLHMKACGIEKTCLELHHRNNVISIDDIDYVEEACTEILAELVKLKKLANEIGLIR